MRYLRWFCENRSKLCALTVLKVLLLQVFRSIFAENTLTFTADDGGSATLTHLFCFEWNDAKIGLQK